MAYVPLSDGGEESDESLLIAGDEDDIVEADNLTLPQDVDFLQSETCAEADTQPPGAAEATNELATATDTVSLCAENGSEPLVDVDTAPASSAEAQQSNVSGTPTQGTTQEGECPRSRHHSRHHRGSSRRRRSRLCRFKRKESNYLAAMCNMAVIVLTCVSIIEPRWFYVRGGKCVNPDKQFVDYMGIKMFFYQGHFVTSHQDSTYYYGDDDHSVLVNCLTTNIVFVMKTIISLCFLALLFSLTACLMDLFGPKHIVFKAIRITASLSILSACIYITIMGLCYLAAEQLMSYYSVKRWHAYSKVDVQFSIGFYMITAAGAVSILAVAFTLVRVRRHSSRRRWSSAAALETDRQPGQLLDTDVERLTGAASTCSQAGRIPPPYRP